MKGYKPELVDNREVTLKEVINEYLPHLQEKLAVDVTLDIATGYFNPEAFFAVQDELEELDNVRILIGARPSGQDTDRHPDIDDPVDDEAYEQQRVEAALEQIEDNIKEDRNVLGFNPSVNKDLQELIEFLRSDSVEVRRYTDGFIHGKAYLFCTEEGVVVGSSNFTGAGLTSNLELNVGLHQQEITQSVREWFEHLWNTSKQYDLAELYEVEFEPYSPYVVYQRALWERYKDELEDDDEYDSSLHLAEFQRDAVKRARRFIDEHGGVVVADEVGLGKTYIAGELLREYVNERRQRAIVIAPAYLRDGMWNSKQSEWGVQFEVVSYAELRQAEQLTGSNSVFDLPIDEYQLVIVDEAHSFRNSSTKQSRALRQLLRGTPPKDLVLLTATPVNNSLWDLYNQIRYFINNDAVFADHGIQSLRERFKIAQSQDPGDLSPDLLFDVLDQTTVRRTRSFIKNKYQSPTIPTGDGDEIEIQFPDTSPQRVDYTLDETFSNSFFNSIKRGLAGGEQDTPELSLARYRTGEYFDEQDENQLPVAGLLRTGLLKRFESSSHAFATTVNQMIAQNEAALELIKNGVTPSPKTIKELVNTESDAFFNKYLADTSPDTEQQTLGGTQQDPVSRSRKGTVPGDTEKFISDVEKDISILQEWHDTATSIDPAKDKKLQELSSELETVVERAKQKSRADPNNGSSVSDDVFRQKRKVLLFSYFEDTADWIYEYLTDVVQQHDELNCYEGRIVVVTGETTKYGITQEDAVHGFAPNSGDAPESATDEYDILITTDVLAQGANLQDAATVINYDLPWNPMRAVQRNGRIDRLNSPHDTIYPTTFFPEDRVDELLDLEQRVQNKITQAAKSVGVDSSIFPELETTNQNFNEKKEHIKQIQEKEQEAYQKDSHDSTASYSGEEYRRDLRHGLKHHEDTITSLPWGAGSGKIGSTPGYFFCARVGDNEFFRFVPVNSVNNLSPVTEEDDVITETLPCIRRVECSEGTERVLPSTMQEHVYDAWKVAKQSILDEWEYKTDQRNIQPDVRKLFREVGEHVRSHWPDNKSQNEMDNITASIEAPHGRRIENEFRGIYESDELSPTEKTEQIIDTVEELGLQPYTPPDPYPRIRDEQVQLVTWMAIAPQNSESR